MMANVSIPILMYHSIESMPRSTVMRSLHVPPKKFNFQMKLLKFLGYRGLSIRDLIPYIRGEKFGKVVGITFDDGYQNNLRYAAPILKKNNFSATCYIVSEYMGMSNIWDLNHGITQNPLMNKSEIQQWLNYGMDIGSHTKKHFDLTSISYQRAELEINESKKELEEQFKVPVVDFCYPFGKFNNSISDIVQNAGYFSATTMIRGRAGENSNIFQLPRIPINHRTAHLLFLLKMLTKYEDNKY